MKTKITMVLAIVSILGFTGCGVVDEITDQLGLGKMTATVNGSSFSAISGCVATRVPAAGGAAEGYSLAAVGTATGYPQIAITMYSTATGTFPLTTVAGVGQNFAVYVQDAATGQGVSNSGSVVISEINYSSGGTVKGTFNFVTATGGFTVTSGSFEAKFAN